MSKVISGAASVGAEIRELRRARGLTQRKLGDLCGISAAYVGHLETYRREADKGLLLRICEKLQIGPIQTAELLQRAGHSAPFTEPLAEVQSVIEDAMQLMSAHSCIFYVSDPYWPDEMRLISMPGVRVRDPMYGFVSPEGTKVVLVRGDAESFCSNAADTAERRDGLARVPSTIPEDVRYLFGDFIEREGIKSSARLLDRNGDRVESVLFVNFDAHIDFEHRSEIKEQCRALRDELALHKDAVIRALSLTDAPIMEQAIRILKPTQDWAADIGQFGDTIEQYFESILETAMGAIGMQPGEGFGTVHLYQPESERLALSAYRGAIDKEGIANAKFQSVLRGEGIISWVALRRRAIVISDLTQSEFRRIHFSVKNGVRSELAVPMLAGKSFMGVLNLESTEPDRFKGEHVRPLWYAANTAAVAARLYRQANVNLELAELNKTLLNWFCNTIHAESSSERNASRADVGTEFTGVPSTASVNPSRSRLTSRIAELSQIARAALKARWCDIWSFDPNLPRPFSVAGASYDLVDVPPRPGGWSDFICRTRTVAWIADIHSRYNFTVAFWDTQGRCWDKSPGKSSVPEALNQRVLDLTITCELGMPILAGNECIGVVWIKFDTASRSLPTEEEMLLAARFAETAGRMLKVLPSSDTAAA